MAITLAFLGNPVPVVAESVAAAGLRVGLGIYLDGQDALVQAAGQYHEDAGLVPIFSLVGLSGEQKFLRDRRTWWYVQELLMVAATEQGEPLPLAAVVLGYATTPGLRLAIGPVFDFETVGPLISVGWALPAGGVFVPVELILVPGFGWRPTNVALWVGVDWVLGGERL
jgi:hypothetical protein